MRAAVMQFGIEGKRDRTRLVVAAERDIRLGVAVDQPFKRAAIRAALPHINLVVAQENFGVDHLSAVGAYAARELEENVIDVSFF
jgi:hypothetical protein